MKPCRNVGFFYAFTVYKAILPFITIIVNNRNYRYIFVHEINNPRSLIYHELRGFNKVTNKQII